MPVPNLIDDPSSVSGSSGHIFMNGQSNKLEKAARLGHNYTGETEFYLVYNPTNGGFEIR